MSVQRSHPNPELTRWSFGEGVPASTHRFRAWRTLLRGTMQLLWDIRVYNRHYEPTRGSVIYICNHQSFFDPILMSVDHVERVSTNEYMLKGAEFTTCPKDHPHFHVVAKEARLVDDKYLKAKGVTVYVGKVPILYLPYWRQKLSKSIFTCNIMAGN